MFIQVVCTPLPQRVDAGNPVAVSEIFQQELLRIQPKYTGTSSLGAITIVNTDLVYIVSVDKAGLKQSLEEALVELSTPQKFVTVTKSRIKKHVHGLKVDSVEETMVSVSVGGEAVTVWRSVCLEASKPDAINALLLREVTGAGLTEKHSLREFLCSGQMLAAYPQFVIDRT